ncbi:hypothetical protein [Emticicia sp. 17c]|uniref:hypothetical protein n=1 Tax=Emticicia sp. 17c TaxID=3127704 RepID=UPI00301D3954
MTQNTELTVIDEVHKALKSRKSEDLISATNLLKVKCHQSKTHFLEFLFDKVFPAYKGLETVLTDFKCPYCIGENTSFKGFVGLKTHISRVHKDKFSEWKETVKQPY